MASTRRRRRLVGALAAVAVVALLAVGLGALALTRGWLDSGDVEGTTQGFEERAAPRGREGAGSWPEYGFDSARSRANPALDSLRPPFRRVWRHDAGSLLEFPPVIADGRVIVGTNAGRALALDARTGAELWNVGLRRTPGRRGRVASSPAIAGDRVLLTTTGGEIVALDAATGAERWRQALGRAIESSPLVIDGAAYVGTLDGEVVRVRLSDGRVAWRADAAGDVKASLAASGPNVVVGDYGGEVRAYARADGRLVWRRTSPGTRLGGSGRFYGGPAVAYGRVYLGNINGRVIALDADSGEVAWVRALDDFVYASPAVADRLVYVGGYDRRLRAYDAVTGRERWSFDAGERISGSASVIGDLVWVSTIARTPSEGRTYALDAATGALRLTVPEGRYSPAVGVEGLLVLTGVRTLTGLVPR